MNATKCPHCKANLIGQLIPKAERKYFGGKTHFMRTIYVTEYAHEFMRRRKYWRCPDCGKEIKMQKVACRTIGSEAKGKLTRKKLHNQKG